MKVIARNEPQEILPIIRDWVHLISEEKWEQACEWLYVPPGSHFVNSPELTKESIAQYSRKYRSAPPSEKEKCRPRVTSPRAMTDGEKVDFLPLPPDQDERGITTVEYFLPLDGKWSDLRAAFKIVPLSSGGFGLLLTDISVP